MTLAASPTGSDVFKAMGDFLAAVLPAGVEVVQSQDNRVPEPKVENFVTMTQVRRPRISTNVDVAEDVAFTAAIAGAVMTVTAAPAGRTIKVGAQVFGTGVAANTRVTQFITGSGGVGTYGVSPSQAVASGTLAAGQVGIVQATEVVVQLDVHGPLSADNAQIISTLMRDPAGVKIFEDAGGAAVPLHADDPRQLSFENAEKQYETRWVVEAHLQVNEAVSGIPQQYAASLEVDLIEVDATYPP